MNAESPSADHLTAAESARLRAQEKLAAHRWPPALLSILERLRGVGPAYLVGGTVRDALLERVSDADFDVSRYAFIRRPSTSP